MSTLTSNAIVRAPGGLLAVVLAFLLGGCGSATANAGDYRAGGGGEEGSTNEIVSAEIREIEASYPTAYEAIRNLRPSWLRVRSNNSLTTTAPLEPIVYVDRIRYGQLRSLYQIGTGDIQGMIYLNSLDATTRYGTGHGGGVIEISVR